MAMLWQDTGGKVSPSRVTALALVCLPACWLAMNAALGQLGPRPMTAAIHETGDWALRLVWLALLIRPARRILDWPRLIGLRRIVGVSAFSYAGLHLTLYAADLKWDLLKVGSEIAQRIYLGLGFASLTALAVLAATSRDSEIRRLGAGAWKDLHRLVYPAAVLMLVHFFLQSKLNVTQPVLMAGLLVWLFGWRWLESNRRTNAGSLVLLAVFAAFATMAIEAAWYGLMTGVPAQQILTANFEFDYEIRMMWWVLAMGFVAAALQAWRGMASTKKPPMRPAAFNNP
ncbi:MAG: ferric reductase-like transmembrane domain-containing protein [Proteobacteria bacterium]|nr:ferric reductase-like transmembrane domain-containing protein [Pseudomonadota bacterium]